jgi:hypothetical protein
VVENTVELRAESFIFLAAVFTVHWCAGNCKSEKIYEKFQKKRFQI